MKSTGHCYQLYAPMFLSVFAQISHILHTIPTQDKNLGFPVPARLVLNTGLVRQSRNIEKQSLIER